MSSPWAGAGGGGDPLCPHSPFPPGKLQNSELHLQLQEAEEEPEAAAGQTPTLALGQMECSRLLRSIGAARKGTANLRHRPKQSRPAGLGVLGLFSLPYQDCTELSCHPSEWFAQGFVDANH